MATQIIKPLVKIGKDSSGAPVITDWRNLNNRMVQVFHDQPPLIRKLADLVIPVSFDGKTEDEIPTLNDLDDAEYDMEPGKAHDALSGGTIIAKLPQIYKTVAITKDKAKMLFAGRSRLPLLFAQLQRKIKIAEEKRGFHGHSGLNVQGLVGSDSTDLGAPTGAWNVDTAGDGILENAQADIDAVVDAAVAAGLGAYRIDIGLTSYAYNLLKNTVASYSPNVTNLDIAERKLNGGKIYVSNYIQDTDTTPVSESENTMIAVIRAPESEAGWAIYSSGFDFSQQQTLWGWEYGMREKFAVKVFDSAFVMYMDHISVV